MYMVGTCTYMLTFPSNLFICAYVLQWFCCYVNMAPSRWTLKALTWSSSLCSPRPLVWSVSCTQVTCCTSHPAAGIMCALWTLASPLAFGGPRCECALRIITVAIVTWYVESRVPIYQVTSYMLSESYNHRGSELLLWFTSFGHEFYFTFNFWVRVRVMVFITAAWCEMLKVNQLSFKGTITNHIWRLEADVITIIPTDIQIHIHALAEEQLVARYVAINWQGTEGQLRISVVTAVKGHAAKPPLSVTWYEVPCCSEQIQLTTL